MYLKELDLYHILKAADTEGKGGVTINMMQHILQSHPEFMFPKEALGAAFKEMLGADIDQIDPMCIIDTEKFVQSLRKEFDGIALRTYSRQN